MYGCVRLLCVCVCVCARLYCGLLCLACVLDNNRLRDHRSAHHRGDQGIMALHVNNTNTRDGVSVCECVYLPASVRPHLLWGFERI